MFPTAPEAPNSTIKGDVPNGFSHSRTKNRTNSEKTSSGSCSSAFAGV